MRISVSPKCVVEIYTNTLWILTACSKCHPPSNMFTGLTVILCLKTLHSVGNRLTNSALILDPLYHSLNTSIDYGPAYVPRLGVIFIHPASSPSLHLKPPYTFSNIESSGTFSSTASNQPTLTSLLPTAAPTW